MKILTRRLAIVFFLCLCAAACQPAPPAAPPNELTRYRAALTPANQDDLVRLDRPTRYALTLAYDPAGPTLSGGADVRYTNRQSVALNEIYFRLFANLPEGGGKITVTRVSMDGAPVSPTWEAHNTALRVPLFTPLAPNATVHAHLDFVVAIPRDNPAHYADFTFTDGVTTLPTVYPLIPAYGAQGWHVEPAPAYGDWVHADMSLYEVSITAPTNQVVIASGSTVETTDHGDGTKTWKIVAAPARDFDINLSDRLEKSSAGVGETTVNSYYHAAETEAGKRALQVAVDALKIFSTRFGAYPYRELDVVATPTTAGGIEYPGVVVLARNLYRSASQRDFFEFATAHEVAHQWWYGVVGNDQVNHPWVDESLTQYSMLIYNEDLRGASAGQALLQNQFQAPYQRARAEKRDQAVNLPVSAYTPLNYGTIVYQKGPLFYDAIRQKMGNAEFFRFLQTYYQTYRYRVATGEDIVATAEDTCKCSLRDEYQQWILNPK